MEYQRPKKEDIIEEAKSNGLRNAARKYAIHHSTISKWIKFNKHGNEQQEDIVMVDLEKEGDKENERNQESDKENKAASEEVINRLQKEVARLTNENNKIKEEIEMKEQLRKEVARLVNENKKIKEETKKVKEETMIQLQKEVDHLNNENNRVKEEIEMKVLTKENSNIQHELKELIQIEKDQIRNYMDRTKSANEKLKAIDSKMIEDLNDYVSRFERKVDQYYSLPADSPQLFNTVTRMYDVIKNVVNKGKDNDVYLDRLEHAYNKAIFKKIPHNSVDKELDQGKLNKLSFFF